MAEQPPILRPLPRRAFEITPASTPSTEPATPSPEHTNPDLLDAKLNGASPPSRTRSILNLTSSTLFGIYSPTGYEVSRDEPSTPWGTGAQTPSHRSSVDWMSLRPPGLEPTKFDSTRTPRPTTPKRDHSFRGFVLPLVLRTILLFAFGIAYGVIITHLHDNQALAPVKVENIDRHSWGYLAFWGVSGVALGSLLPWFDVLWEDALGGEGQQTNTQRLNGRPRSTSDSGNLERPPSRSGNQSGVAADWTPVVRSVGAFIGIAFAIRKLPWQSTLQVSLTLALVNPALWYIIDRSKPGFLLSAVVGVAGTLVLLSINPDMVPPPSASFAKISIKNDSSHELGSGLNRLITNESIGVGTWIASVLFCSCVCFGNIGRRLGLGVGYRDA